jgi:hypothetical protein
MTDTHLEGARGRLSVRSMMTARTCPAERLVVLRITT